MRERRGGRLPEESLFVGLEIVNDAEGSSEEDELQESQGQQRLILPFLSILVRHQGCPRVFTPQPQHVLQLQAAWLSVPGLLPAPLHLLVGMELAALFSS